MRILLSGATGQLGRAFARTLPALGQVFAPGRKEFDLSSEADMRRVLDQFRPDLIVNTAAYTAVDMAEIDQDMAIAINGHAPGHIARWAAANSAALLHYSTDYVFNGTKNTPYRETDPTDPVNAYGASKLAGEIAIAQSGADHLIIRTSWLYDADGTNFLRTILSLARERTSLTIVSDQVGAPTPAWWLAEASTKIVAMADGGPIFSGNRSGILHAAPSGTTSWHGFATAIVEGARSRSVPLAAETIAPIPSTAYPTPAARPKNSVFCLDRLRQDFGIAPPHWRDALQPVLDAVADAEKAASA